MDNRSIVISTTKRKPSPKIGKFSSDDYNLFCDSVVNDINSLVLSVNSLYTQNLNLLERLKSETSFLKKRIADLEADKRLEQYSAARFGTTVRDLIDFHDTKNLSHPSNQPNRLKALINSEFGQATVPARLIENKFFFQSLISGNIVPPADLVVSVSSVFNKYEGDGEIDYEYGGTVEAGDPKNAFNGSYTSIWERIVSFPLNSDVSEVECELTVIVPSQLISKSNVLSILPFPYGDIDITSISFSNALDDSFYNVPGFESTNNARHERYFFPPQDVSQIKIRLRQRNWYEDRNRKIFKYGIEELNLQLVEWEKTYVAGGTIDKNCVFIVRFDAPENYVFSSMRSIIFNPDFTIEEISNRNVHVVISGTPDFSQSIWNSDQNGLPQDFQNGVALPGISTIYAIVTLQFVTSTSNSSPFYVDTPAYLKSIGIEYTVEEA